MEKRKALGRGLDALIPEVNIFTDQQQQSISGETVAYVSIDKIKPNKYQPREDFNQDKLNDLITSVKEKGVVQPLLARNTENGIELIAGERRLRALKALGIEKAPVIIKKVDDLGAMELALIENVQRQELNALEEAHAYKRLMVEFGFTHEQIAQKIGKDRSSIANILRLLNLPLEIQRHLSQDRITMGHARALLAVAGLQQQLNLCNKIIRKGLSVREAELLVNPKIGRKQKPTTQKEHYITEQEEQLQARLGTKVRIQHGKKRGKIIIEYYSLEDLNRITEHIKI